MKRDHFDFSGLQGRRHLYRADLGGVGGDMSVGLSLPARVDGPAVAPARLTLDAALALRHAEPVMAAVEDWLGLGLVPQPWRGDKGAAEERRWASSHVCVWHEASDTRLYLPAALLAQAAPPPAALSGWRWGTLRCRVVLDVLTLQPHDVVHLRVGAMVLLPASFRGEWQARLVPAALPGMAMGARWRLGDAGLVLHPSGQAVARPEGLPLVSLPGHVSVPVGALLGWPGRPPLPLLAPASAAALHGAGASYTECHAQGRLVPVGTGMGLLVTRLRWPSQPLAA